MIITIQPLKKGYAIVVTDTYTFPNANQFQITKRADQFAEFAFLQTGERPMIKILPIKHTPMATKTPPAKKAKALKKLAKKKVVKGKKK